MQVADHFSAVKRRFESRAMPAYEKPPARLVDIYYGPKLENSASYVSFLMFKLIVTLSITL